MRATRRRSSKRPWCWGTPFYDVKTHIGLLGRWVNGSFHSVGMTQADPKEDYKLTQQRPNTRLPGEPFDEVHAKWLFIHHNLVKIDSRNANGSLEKAMEVDGAVDQQRLWGGEESIEADSRIRRGKGYVETALSAGCPPDMCDRLRNWVKAVFQ